MRFSEGRIQRSVVRPPNQCWWRQLRTYRRDRTASRSYQHRRAPRTVRTATSVALPLKTFAAVPVLHSARLTRLRYSPRDSWRHATDNKKEANATALAERNDVDEGLLTLTEPRRGYSICWCVTGRDWVDDVSSRRNCVNTACLGGTHDHATGESGGCWSVAGALRAFRKPGSPMVGHLGPIREYVASVLGHWLGVAIPHTELDLRGSAPVALLMEVPRALSYAHLDSCGFCAPKKGDALSAFNAFAGVVVLDALVGVQNRPKNHGNHVYSLETKAWSSLDYADSFSHDFSQPYQAPFVDAVRARWRPIAAKELVLAANISEDALRRLLSAAPKEFATQGERRQMLRFLLDRQARLEDVLLKWLSAH